MIIAVVIVGEGDWLGDTRSEIGSGDGFSVGFGERAVLMKAMIDFATGLVATGATVGVDLSEGVGVIVGVIVG